MLDASVSLVCSKAVLNLSASVTNDESPKQVAKSMSAYATECLIVLCNLAVSTTPFRRPLFLVMGTAIPGEAGELVGRFTAERKGRAERMKVREKYISSWTGKPAG